ncbi:MAG: DMT family transporter [Gammaproteobacteria bacterium]|nr:DMT family transporter [Gammaproteobacteria bacterium]
MPRNPPSPKTPPPATASTTWPTLAILASTVLWGTWWIPLRKLDALGFGSIWSTGAGLMIPLLAMLPVVVVHRRRIARAGRPLLLGAFFFACALAMYAEGMLRGQVARVILLFYLTPVWSTLLARFMLGQPITPRRILTLVFGLSGMLVILEVDNASPLPRDVGEWLGLASGVAWGLAMVYTRRTRAHPVADKVALQFIFLVVIFAALTAIPGGRQWSAAGLEADFSPWLWLWLPGFALVWNLPVVWLTFYGGGRIEPGRVAILLMMEVAIGIVTASLFTDEPFGLRELLGAVLIIAAGLTEFVRVAPIPRPPQRDPG